MPSLMAGQIRCCSKMPCISTKEQRKEILDALSASSPQEALGWRLPHPWPPLPPSSSCEARLERLFGDSIAFPKTRVFLFLVLLLTGREADEKRCGVSGVSIFVRQATGRSTEGAVSAVDEWA